MSMNSTYTYHNNNNNNNNNIKNNNNNNNNNFILSIMCLINIGCILRGNLHSAFNFIKRLVSWHLPHLHQNHEYSIEIPPYSHRFLTCCNELQYSTDCKMLSARFLFIYYAEWTAFPAAFKCNNISCMTHKEHKYFMALAH